MNKISNYFSGISGLQLPVPKYLFPESFQNSSRLEYYASFFNSIEINSSFYKIPLSRTLLKWSAMVNDDFRFTFKLFKEITHVKNLEYKEADVAQFMNAISSIKQKGCLLIQFPPSLNNLNYYQLDKLVTSIINYDVERRWSIAIEFRNKSWYNEDVYALIENHKASIVLHDISISATPFHINNPFTAYVRFHGPEGNYRGSYDENLLSEYAGYIKEWIAEGKTVYTYFNNTMGQAFDNLTSLNHLIREI